MMAPTSANDDLLSVDMPSENDVKDESSLISPVELDGNDDGDESASHRQRSLLKTLWSEATSTTDLPPPPNHRLHHRRATAAAAARKGSDNGIAGMSSPSKRRTGRQSHPHRYRVGRGGRIAKRVWLAAFAALAASFLIAVHVFLYRVFTESGGANNNSDPIGNSLGSMTENGAVILAVEDQEAKMTLAEARSHELAPIDVHSIDTSQYTIRMNTWQRNELLLLSINHHARCEGVKEIQVIWCDSNNKPPVDVTHHPSGKVKIETHTINSLNERFKVILDAPTLGILSLDDDVLRPCEALDAAFARWTRHPDRMVGFDARTHVVDDSNVEDEEKKNGGGREGKSKWKYGYMSTTESSNRYSMTLPRASFLHRDYLDLYVLGLPRPIYAYVAQNLECEDVAMSFLVSSLTDGRPPLLADYWAVKSMVKLFSERKISGGKDHKSTRDRCVNDFAELLGIKEDGKQPLRTEKLIHSKQFFGYGAEPEDWMDIDPISFGSPRLQAIVETMRALQSSSNEKRMGWLMQQKAVTMREAKAAGMIEQTEEWKERWEMKSIE